MGNPTGKWAKTTTDDSPRILKRPLTVFTGRHECTASPAETPFLSRLGANSWKLA